MTTHHYTAIIIIILICLLYELYQNYRSFVIENISWSNPGAKLLLWRFMDRFGAPCTINSDSAIYYKEIFTKLVITDTDRCLTASLPLKFFNTCINQEISPCAYRTMLTNIHKLSNISCDSSRLFNIHCKDWMSAIINAILLIKITECKTNITDIKKRDLYQKYIRKYELNPVRYEQRIKKYISEISGISGSNGSDL